MNKLNFSRLNEFQISMSFRQIKKYSEISSCFVIEYHLFYYKISNERF